MKKAIQILLLATYFVTVPQLLADQVPMIIKENGKERLILPQPILDFISTNYAGYRIPSSVDLKANWEARKEPGKFPFVTWGDFDGNGETDVMLLLLGPAVVGEEYWIYQGDYAEVIFHQVNSSFVVKFDHKSSFSSEGPKYPQEITYKLMKKGETIQIGKTESYTAIHDSILDDFLELDTSIWYWNGTGYDYKTVSSPHFNEP